MGERIVCFSMKEISASQPEGSNAPQRLLLCCMTGTSHVQFFFFLE